MILSNISLLITTNPDSFVDDRPRVSLQLAGIHTLVFQILPDDPEEMLVDDLVEPLDIRLLKIFPILVVTPAITNTAQGAKIKSAIFSNLLLYLLLPPGTTNGPCHPPRHAQGCL